MAIDTAHLTPTKPNPSLLQQGKNLGCMLSAAMRILVRKITHSNQHRVTFAGQAMMAEYNIKNSTVIVTYDSGADRHYLSKKGRKLVGLQVSSWVGWQSATLWTPPRVFTRPLLRQLVT